MELLKILVFRIGKGYFGLPSKNVKEIVDSCGSLKTVFYGGRALKGLMNMDGDFVSVLNAPFILDAEDEREASMVLICREKGMERAVGMTVSEVRGMEVVLDSRISRSQDNDANYISGFLKEGEGDDERTVAILDLKQFFDLADTKIERM